MEFRPVLNALMRNKTGLLLIVLQVAITLAIVCNSVFIILQRIEKVNRPSGMDEANLFTVTSLGFASDFDLPGTLRQDLDALRSIPGVVDATTINSVPLSQGGWSEGLSDQPDSVPQDKRKREGSAIYMVDEHGANTLGVRIVAGRNFNAGDVSGRTKDDKGSLHSVIITQALADKLFPGGAVGKTLYSSLPGKDGPVTVVGVIERLQAPWVGWDKVEQAMLVPQYDHGEFDASSSRYLVRTEPGRRDEIMKEAERKLGEVNSGRIVRGLRSIEEVRGESYRQDRAMTVVLTTVIFSLLAVTGLGIVGMVSFWVTRRIKQIGTRRALGARRFDIRRYFMIENLIVVGIGIALGLLLTYGFNLWLMKHYELPRLAWYYAPVGALTVLLLGQLAVFGPATRATRVSPAVATRTV
ncbi:putative ABC transport system permease protein [Lysobacter niastensis]|uniref:ABC transport system permease protein n=1 Tax=Lysobacter niastensis TaxID=380629 RepID=A0ABU1W743_9GAMM|nr:FtsX-like permease family protein [Lysobacter niastensis]MDR7133401.1 putative ABC transport system permease protein [Lysobacter niastensis]